MTGRKIEQLKTQRKRSESFVEGTEKVVNVKYHELLSVLMRQVRIFFGVVVKNVS